MELGLNVTSVFDLLFNNMVAVHIKIFSIFYIKIFSIFYVDAKRKSLKSNDYVTFPSRMYGKELL